jgi:hypothetical protein
MDTSGRNICFREFELENVFKLYGGTMFLVKKKTAVGAFFNWFILVS